MTEPTYFIDGHAIFRRCKSFNERVYEIEPTLRGHWSRRAFTSGGWWKSDGGWRDYASAAAALAALCDRLNGNR